MDEVMGAAGAVPRSDFDANQARTATGKRLEASDRGHGNPTIPPPETQPNAASASFVALAEELRRADSALQTPNLGVSTKVLDLPAGATPVPIVSSSASTSCYPWTSTTASYDGSATTVWMTAGNAVNGGKDYRPWVQYDFDRVYALDSMRILNFTNPEYWHGVKDAEVLVSQDGTTFSSLGYRLFTASDATGIWQSLPLGGQPAKSVKFVIHTNYYDTVFYDSPTIEGPFPNASIPGLSEVQFYATVASNGPCAPSCTGKICGSDGCGGYCNGQLCTGSGCILNSDCAGGLVCSGVAPGSSVASICQPVNYPGSCTNGVRDVTETDVDCGGLCGACGKGHTCKVDGDCGTTRVCGENNGAHFGLARSAKVCWNPTCEVSVQAGGCGQEGSPCGKNCVGVTSCLAGDSTNSCAASEVCAPGLGAMFGSEWTDVCVNVACPSNDPALCGGPHKLCGSECQSYSTVPIASSSASSYYDWRFPTTASYDGDPTTLWMTAGNSVNEGKDYTPWIQYNFDRPYVLESMRFVSFPYEYLRTAKDVEIFVSQDGTAFTSAGYKQFPPGAPAITWRSIDFAGLTGVVGQPVKSIKLAIHTNYYGGLFYGPPPQPPQEPWANASVVGFPEVRFYTSELSGPAAGIPVSLQVQQGESLSDFAIVGQSVFLDEGVRVLNPVTGQAAAVSSIGAGGVTVGNDGVVGRIRSSSGVQLGNAVHAEGGIEAAGQISAPSNVSYVGTRVPNAGTVALTAESLSVPWPTDVAQPLAVTTQQTVSPSVRHFTDVTVHPGGSLVLQAGDYFFDSLNVRDGGQLTALNTAGAVRIFVLNAITFAGALTRQSEGSNVVFVSMGTSPVQLLASLRAAVWAPLGDITLGGSPRVFQGTFIGRTVHAFPGALIFIEPTIARPIFAKAGGIPDQCGIGGAYIKTYVLGAHNNWLAGISEYPVDVLENSRDWVCYLSKLGGSLQLQLGYGHQWDRSIWYGNSSGTLGKYHDYWGGYAPSDIQAEATCVHKSCFASNSLTSHGPYETTAEALKSGVLNQNCNLAQSSAPAGGIDEATALTAFAPYNPHGGAERTWVEQSSTVQPTVHAMDGWCDDADRPNGHGVSGSAYSFRAGPIGQPALFDGPNAKRSVIETAGVYSLDSAGGDTGEKNMFLAPVDDAICFLTGISGRWGGGGEYAKVSRVFNHFDDKEYWFLHVQHLQGGAPNGVQAQATCYARNQDACSNALPGTDSQICDPLVRQRFQWEQSPNQQQDPAPARDMGSAADRACFLTELSGKFQGGAEKVAVEKVDGAWQLNGWSNQVSVRGIAQCVATRDTTDEFNWSLHDAPVNLGPADGRACFLTRVQGRLGGGGESLHVFVANGSWWLTGASLQTQLSAAARCIPVESFTPEFTWRQGDPEVQLTTDPPNPRDFCFLTGVSGRFEGGGEIVGIRSTQGATGSRVQSLYGASQQVGVLGQAVCARLLVDPIAGQSEPVPLVTRDCTVHELRAGWPYVDDPSRVCFANEFSGTQFRGGSGELEATGQWCRPHSCFQGDDPDDIVAVSPTFITYVVDECAHASVPMLGVDSVSHLLYLRGEANGGDEYGEIEQASSAAPLSQLTLHSCTAGTSFIAGVESFNGAAASLTLGKIGTPVKFIDHNGEIAEYGTPNHDFDFKVSTEAGQDFVVMTPAETSSCVFTRVTGKFAGGGEFVRLGREQIAGVERWTLRAQHLSGPGVGATARCFPNLQNGH